MHAQPIEVRPLGDQDLDEADRVLREAFQAFLGADVFGDADYVRTRWAADQAAALGAFVDGRLVGSNFATRWGSVGFFGPLTVRPELWDRGIGSRLAVLEGLDVEREISAVVDQGLGDVALLPDDAGVRGFAVCHIGAGSEAGSGRCYVKFGAARPGRGAAEAFAGLLDASEALAAERGSERLVAGVNTGRHEAYQAMLAHGFRTDLSGVTMHRPVEPGYDRPDIFLIDDWR